MRTHRITYLSSASLGVLLLDLNFADVAWMLNDLGNVRLVSSSNLTRDTFSKIRKSTIHPVLPEDTDAVAKGRKVGLNHTESSMDRPEDKEDDEQVMCIPETLEVGTARLLSSRQGNSHQGDQHHISTPTRARRKIG